MYIYSQLGFVLQEYVEIYDISTVEVIFVVLNISYLYTLYMGQNIKTKYTNQIQK